MTTKREEFRQKIQDRTREAIKLACFDMDDATRQIIKRNIEVMASQISWHVSEQYRFLEFSDLFEWKRQKVRR